jgi:uncharacterized protein YbjT (DUF2867 family)
VNVVVIGGGEAVVESLVRRALEEGHAVTLVSAAAERSPRPEGADRLRVVHANVFARPSLDGVLRGQDAVLFAAGAAAARAAAASLSGAVRDVIAAMGAGGVRRLVCLSDGAADPSRDGRSLFGRLFRRADATQGDDVRRMEVAVRASDLEWVIVRPARLVDGPARGTYREGPGYALPGGGKIACDDAAVFLVHQLSDRRYVGHAVAVAW